MKILFIHQNFPAQFRQVALYLAENPANTVVAIRQAPVLEFENIATVTYRLKHGAIPHQHPLMTEWEAKILRAEAVAKACVVLKNQGFTPDIVVVHPGWGEALLLRDIWPSSKYLGYFEYFYADKGQDFDFDPEFPVHGLDALAKLRLKNTANLHALQDMDAGITPTYWQRDTYPAWSREKIEVMHEGIDTDFFCSDPKRTLTITSKGITLTNKDEVVTYAARYLEPVRGFHCFMRALPDLLERRPNAHIIIMGSDDGGYGLPPESHATWEEMMLEEVGEHLDPNRVHILGRLEKEEYRRVLQLSKVHVYMTYPFLLSWSMLEAMACGLLLVASDTPPVREIVQDGKNGLLFDFFDKDALVNRIDEALGLPTRKANALRKAARKTIQEQYNVEICMRQLIGKIENLLS